MRGFFIILALVSGSPELDFQAKDIERLDSAVVSVSRASQNTPVTFSMVGKRELESVSPISSLPMTLQFQPSVVSSNEGGTGLGYSKLRIRGSKGSQINVTLNGITLNDAESQEVFWVNIPALGTLLSSVQLQRGLGTSEAGAGAFGASINMNTAMVRSEPSVTFDYARGSWNTATASLSATTGLSSKGFYANFAYSHNTTDGYIRNAWADVESMLAVVGWIHGSHSLKLTYLRGHQHTGITWNGASAAKLALDRRYNGAGEYYDAFGNVYYYDNESDNYIQQHVQLNYSVQISEPWVLSTTLNYTRGDGYYEQYKTDKKLSAYGFDSPVEIEGVSYKKGDFIIRKEMGNDYYVLNSNLTYTKDAIKATFGVNASIYDGDHFGNVLWSNLLGDIDNHRWYSNNGLKKELNFFARSEYSFTDKLTAYADLQYRGIGLDMKGVDDDALKLDYSTGWAFFNPRAGLVYRPTDRSRIYGSVAFGNREPGRSDIKEAWDRLKPEKMLDTELGYELVREKFSFAATLYDMEYWDMLLETGRLSDTGYAIKENVGRAYRRGIELSAGLKLSRKFSVDGNIALSVNKLKNFVAYYETYDNMTDWTPMSYQKSEEYHNTSMLMSPSIVGALHLEYNPFSAIKFNAFAKFVGKQYWDNTQCDDRSLPAYGTLDLSISDTFKMRSAGSLEIGLYVNNALNTLYNADAWVYRAYFEAEQQFYQDEGLFPQSPINFMLRAIYRF